MSVDIFDRVYDAYTGEMGLQFMRETQRRMHWICSATHGNAVLDVGCSQGVLPILLGREGRSVTGIDSDPRSIRDAERHLAEEAPGVRKRVSFVEADFLCHSFGDERFDTIVMGEVLEHLVSPERFIARARELLKPDGLLVVTVPFGINDHPDHKRTYYLLEPYRLLAAELQVTSHDILGKWLGLTAKQREASDTPTTWSDGALREVEKAFNHIERALVDDSTFLRSKLDEANVKYRAATEEVSRLQRDSQQHDGERKSAEKTRSQLEVRVAAHDKERHEAEQAHERAVSGVREELAAAREKRHGLELSLARLEERHSALEQRQALELGLRDAAAAELRSSLATLQERHATLASELAEQKALQNIERAQQTARELEHAKQGADQLRQAESLLAQQADLERQIAESRSAVELAVRERELDRQRFTSALAEEQQRFGVAAAKRAELEAALQARDRASTERSASHTAQLSSLHLEHDALRGAVGAKERELEQKARDVRDKERELSQLRQEQQDQAQKTELLRAQLATATQAELAAKHAELTAKQAERKALGQIETAGRARSAAERKIKQVQNTLSFQLGYQLIHGFKSPEGAMKLPKALWSLQQEAARRRHDRSLREGNALTSRPERIAARLESTGAQLIPLPVIPTTPPVVVSAPVPVSAPAAETKSPALQLVPKLRPAPLALDSGLERLKVACIHDEFTFASFAPDCVLEQLTPNGFRQELEAFQPDLLFVESAWRGKDDLWGSKVGHRSRELVEAVAWCNERGIPTVFWNKEDPVHFQGFLSTAQLFDFVFTTDFDCIHRYKRALGHDRVYVLPFGCQPKQHNPLEKYQRKSGACFAGAYYARYPERQQDLAGLARALGDVVGLEIYDRNHGKDDPNFQFPEEYRKYIVGTLPFDEIDRAYKGYRYALNLNSIKQSQTMFARRLFELLASNTLTISNFSRGIRTLFGDLVIATDSGERALQRLSEFERDPSVARRVQLAALRKVLTEHTYGERLKYVVAKVWSRAPRNTAPNIAVVALASTQAELAQIFASYARQSHGNKTLLLATAIELDSRTLSKDRSVQLVAMDSLRGELVGARLKNADFVAGMLASDHYGDNYLTDLALATAYSEAPIIGKRARYRALAIGGVGLIDDGTQYQTGRSLPQRAAMVRMRFVAHRTLHDYLQQLPTANLEHADALALDEFNYCEAGAALDPGALTQVDDLRDLDHGLSLSRVLSTPVSAASESTSIAPRPQIAAKRLSQLLRPKRDSAVSLSFQDDALRVRSSLPDETHEYVYASEIWPIGELGPALEKLHFDASPGLNLQLALLFVDANKQRVGNKLLLAGRNEQLAPPAGAAQVQLALRVYGAGTSKINGLVLDHLPEAPAHIFARSDYLLLTNHYPSYTDLYRNGFVHQRVLGYRRQGTRVDVFRMRRGETLRYSEFEGIDVASGGADALRTQLGSHPYKVVLIHFLDEHMWQVLREVCAERPLLIWVHGAEVQSFIRREYNYSTPESLAGAKKESEARSVFWRKVSQELPRHSKLIFVSRGFADESMQDNGFRVPESRIEIIHNVIDGELFGYRPKTAEHRKRILSLRPFASRKYANDLTVHAILELAKRPFFSELEFYFAGDGPLFDETVAPLRHLPNVKLERRFFAQREISELHQNYGIFMCPTRADSQGVSRDEAMASGLVPITSDVGAVSEFVDHECGILTDGESFAQLADAVEALYRDPARFLRLSTNAAERVRRQSGPEQTTQRELRILRATSAASDLGKGADQ